MKQYKISIKGTVIKGKQLGRKLGFPTANINLLPTEQVSPGVYSGYIVLADKSKHKAAIILGIPNDKSSLNAEAHILNFDQDLYGQQITMITELFIRPLQKFESQKDLITAITNDINQIKKIMK